MMGSAMVASHAKRIFIGGVSGGSGLVFSAAVIGGINLVGFGITAVTKTHRVTDLFGAGSFVASAISSAILNGVHTQPLSRPSLLTIAVSLWGTRLACFLFERIISSPHDPRLASFLPEKGEKWFDQSKSNFPLSLIGFWTIQAMWAWIVSLPVTLVNFNFNRKAISQEMTQLKSGSRVAFAAFLIGLAIEAIADWQKRQFKKIPANRDKWVDEGLWAISRHPNYLGEMILWWSLYCASVPGLKSRKQLLLGACSPAFISFLLLFVSGIPMLEKHSDEKYGKNKKYLEYKERVPVLIPRFR